MKKLALVGFGLVALVLALVPWRERPMRRRWAPEAARADPSSAAEELRDPTRSGSSRQESRLWRDDGDPASGACTIFVVAESGSPRAAELALVPRSGMPRVLGRTDEGGRLSFFPPPAPFTLVAKGARIRTRERLVEKVTAVIRVVVCDGCSASGRVILSGSAAPAPAGTVVVAWPQAWRSAPEDLGARVRAGDPRLLMAKTDEGGFFELSGLGDDVDYCATAATPGWCDWPPSRLQPSDDNVLRMRYIVGVRAIVRENDGSPIRTGPVRAYGRRLAIQPPALAGAPYLPVPNPVSELMGASPPPHCGDPTQAEALFACTEPVDALGPLHFEAVLPGYSIEAAELWAVPTDHGLFEQTIPASPTREDRRDIRLEFADVPAEGAVLLAIRAGVGQVVLSSGEGDFFADVETFSRPMILHSIPRSMALRSVSVWAGETRAVPCVRSSLTPETEVWTADLGQLQTVGVDLVQPDGTPYQGPTMILLGKTSESFGTPVFFERAPYVLFAASAPDAYVLWAYPGSGILAPEPGNPRRRVGVGWP